MAYTSAVSASARKVPVQVLNLSLPRTGSVSLKAALEKLGIPIYHGFDFVASQRDQIAWGKAVDAKWYGKGKPFERQEFDEFLGEWAGLSDFPVVGFAEEMIEAYPEVRVQAAMGI